MDRTRLAHPLGALLLITVVAGGFTLLIGGLEGGGRGVGGASVGSSAAMGRAPATLAAVVPSRPRDRTLYLVPIGDFPRETAIELAVYYDARYGLEMTVRPALPLDESARDRARRQLVAERLLDQLWGGYPDLAADDGAVVIGLVVDDLHILGRPDWSWAFGLRDEARYAIVSTARMADADPGVAASRLRKMVSRDIGILYYGLALNDDRSSVLFRDVLGAGDLDRMTEDF